jgi:hypothetical protein
MKNVIISFVLLMAVVADVNGALRALRQIESSKIIIVL